MEDTHKEVNHIAISIDIVQHNNQLHIALGLVNTNARRMYFCSFLDNQFLSHLESILLQLNPENHDCDTKIMVPRLDMKNLEEKLQDILEQINITVVNKSHGSHDNYMADIQKLIKENQASIHTEGEHQRSFQCLSEAIRCLNLVQEESENNQYSLVHYKSEEFMRLDLAAMNALLVFPKEKTVLQTAQGQQGTLLELLDQCRTKIGSRCLTRWMKQPLQSVQEIDQRLDVVEEMVLNVPLRQEIQDDFLRKVGDLDKLFVRFYRAYSDKKGMSASLHDVYKVYQLVQSLKKAEEILQGSTYKKHPRVCRQVVVQPLVQCLADFERLEELVDKMVDIDKAQKGEYLIRSSYSQELSTLEDNMEAIRQQMDQVVADTAHDLNCHVTLQENNSHGYVMEVDKKKGDEGLRRSRETYKQITIKLGKITLNNQALRHLVENYQQANNDYKRHQMQLSTKIIKIVSTYYPVMEQASHFISQIDVLLTFAQVSSAAVTPYVRPQMKNQGDLVLVASRHPCLEVIRRTEGVVANDCHFSLQHSNVHIITGPNMGGKSTYIRQVGINCLMAHIGCFVPAQEASIPILDALITRVGASDVQLKGISTFFQEMLEVSNMLSSATPRSLLIIDELGRGTSTHDGYGLAYAIAEHLASTGTGLALFATHFHELTQLAQHNTRVQNYYVDAQVKEDSISMNYTIRPGSALQSYGIFLMAKMDFPQQVVDNARNKLKELQYAIDSKHNDKIEQEHQNEGQTVEQRMRDATLWEKREVIRVYNEMKGADESMIRQAVQAVFQ